MEQWDKISLTRFAAKSTCAESTPETSSNLALRLAAQASHLMMHVRNDACLPIADDQSNQAHPKPVMLNFNAVRGH